MDDDERAFAALGVYDPEAPHAAARLRALRLLGGHGATPDELVECSDALGALSARISLRPPGPRTTLRDASVALGMSLDDLQRLWRALGFAEPGPDDAVVPSSLEGAIQ